ncbi:hypothetical protein [Tautonia rosea]|uniref:hypothetical protein n=1 Tax=Tautonia rosea TaxID=2728037 RepID=UPI0014727F71|nr:hypothetical protein [Tautonia rosea]
MGNRACVLFFDPERVSPTVYLHWHGDAVPAWLEELRHLMSGRTRDASYATARFVGICHSRIAGNLNLGITSNGLSPSDLRDRGLLAGLSPGNAGIVVVDTADFRWAAYGGYLANHRNQPTRKEQDQ